MEEIVVSFEGVVAGYQDAPIVAIDRLDLRAGEVTALTGRSGIGKTTLLRCISGELEPMSGRIKVTGRQEGLRAQSGNASRTIQSFPLLHWLTVRENLKLAARIRGCDSVDTGSVLESVRADHLADRYPPDLSGGERCRASLAQAIVGSPRLLLLDEPFTGLDTIVKMSVVGVLLGFAQDHGATVVIVTHDLSDACEFASRVLVLGGSKPARVIGDIPTDRSGAYGTLVSMLSSEGGVSVQ